METNPFGCRSPFSFNAFPEQDVRDGEILVRFCYKMYFSHVSGKFSLSQNVRSKQTKAYDEIFVVPASVQTTMN
jgi:hypothetical protein